MTKKNNFTAQTHFLFLEDNYWKCWGFDENGNPCGKNHANCGHHIFGRGSEEGCEKSPFNYAPLSNFECHLPVHGRLMTDRGRAILLKKTIDHLSNIGYTLTKEDEEFLTKYDKQIKKLKISI